MKLSLRSLRAIPLLSAYCALALLGSSCTSALSCFLACATALLVLPDLRYALAYALLCTILGAASSGAIASWMHASAACLGICAARVLRIRAPRDLCIALLAYAGGLLASGTVDAYGVPLMYSLMACSSLVRAADGGAARQVEVPEDLYLSAALGVAPHYFSALALWLLGDLIISPHLSARALAWSALAGAIEECFFRRAVFEPLREIVGSSRSYAIVVLLHAASHLNLGGVAASLVPALALAPTCILFQEVYLDRGLLCSSMAHAIFNVSGSLYSMAYAPRPMAVAAVVVLAISALTRLKRQKGLSR